MDKTGEFSSTYEITGQLGAGSGGIVYKAYHKRLKKDVVLKKIRNKSISMAVNRQEVDILKNLNHSYLPQVLDFLEIDGELFTVMSYIPGESFKDLMKRNPQFTQNQLIRWGMQVCSALNYLHSQNPPIIHSDIKPANIMLTPAGNICLIDFNISFFLDDSTILGYTDGYTSPEQYIIALSSKSVKSIPQYSVVDEKTDIYSVGATFYHLATGKKIKDYKEKPDVDLLEQKCGEALAHVIEKAMRINPEERFQSAFEMFQAFKQIPEKDVRYRRLLKRQMGYRISMILLLAGFIGLGGYGVHTLKLERVEKYNDLVSRQISYREDEKYGKAETIYKQAVKVLPSGVESYYQNACSLYQQKKYQECIEFIDYDILQNEKIDKLQTRMADIYYLKADSHFQLKEYEQAVLAYESVMKFGAQKSEYYRDYAIALAYDGRAEKAEEILQEAIDYGLKEDSIYYAKGEIENSLGSQADAIKEFESCIQLTDDTQLKERSYIMLGQIYKESGNLEMAKSKLQEAGSSLPLENQMRVLENLAQVNIELAEKSGQEQFRTEAISVLNEIVAQGWDTYETYDTLAILNEKQMNLSEVERVLETMLKLYGEDYNIYKRFAFLEIDKQELLENMARDYGRFQEYYEKSTQMYFEQLQNNDTDTEMQLLDHVYEQVKTGGWL